MGIIKTSRIPSIIGKRRSRTRLPSVAAALVLEIEHAAAASADPNPGTMDAVKRLWH